MALFEIHQRFKGHFLNELRVSFLEHLVRRTTVSGHTLLLVRNGRGGRCQILLKT